MKPMHRVILKHIDRLNLENKEKLCEFVMDNDMFDMSRVPHDSWIEILSCMPEAADKCPWNKLSLKCYMRLHKEHGNDFKKYYTYDHIPYNEMREVMYNGDYDYNVSAGIKEIVKKYDFSKMFGHEVYGLLKSKYGNILLGKIPKSTLLTIPRNDVARLLHGCPEYVKVMPMEQWKRVSKTLLSHFIKKNPSLAKKYVPLDVMKGLYIKDWRYAVRMVPELLTHLDIKKLKGQRARELIEEFPLVLAGRDILHFGMSHTDWKRMLKKRPDIEAYLPTDYKHSFVILALKKKTK